MNERGFILNIIIIILILVLVFLSQQPYFRPTAKSLYTNTGKITSPYTSKIGDWLKASIYPKVSQEVANRGATAQQAITEQKNNLMQNIWENFKNFFAEKFSKISGTQVK